jgi:Protein of unknown function (DUF3769)
MPYLASPPAPPPIVTPACEIDRCASPAPPVASSPELAPESVPESTRSTLDPASARSTPESARAVIASAPARSTAPEVSPSYLRVTEFSQQSGQPSATLLLEPTATDDPAPQSSVLEIAPSAKAESSSPAPLVVPSPAVLRFPESPEAALPPFISKATDRTTDAEYVIEGTTSRLTKPGETTVLTELHQAVNLGRFWGDFSGLRVIPRQTGQPPISPIAAQGITTPEDPPFPAQQPLPDGQAPIFIPVQPISPASPLTPEAPTTPPPTTPPSPPAVTPRPVAPIAPPPGLTVPPGTAGIIEVSADRQEYDSNRQVFTAEGRVLMRFQGALLDADRLQVNLTNRLAVAEGNVALTRGNQVLRGQRFEYNFVQGDGTVRKARGDIYLPTSTNDFLIPLGNDNSAETILGRPLSDRISSAQPVQGVTTTGGVSISVGLGRDVNRIPGALPQGGTLKRLRFEAEQVDFTADNWVARDIQITNDPFSPPELILRAERATFTRVAPLRDELRAIRPRLVFDQRFTLPVPVRRLVFNREPQPPPLVQFGYDFNDRGGVFVERTFRVLSSPNVNLTITPQFLIQRAFTSGNGFLDAANFGVKARLLANISPQTQIFGRFNLPTFKASEFNDKLRASIRARQLVGTHTLSFEYSYRDRLFNGSLGFQTVQTSLGFLLSSPRVTLGNTGITLTYQVGYQFINATTDRLDLLDVGRTNDRINLGRFQATAALSRGFLLWAGKALPATRDQGLKYTPFPITPYVSVGVGLTGVLSAYTKGETQNNLNASIGLGGQFGHFSRPFLDYTAFNITYSQVIRSGSSPFLFDRIVDNRILSLALTQQIYGPVRFTIQTALNLDTRAAISTDYLLEYSRRTYGVILRYNPTLRIGSINFRVSDFNWTGGSEPFSGVEVKPVEGGIIRSIDD